MRDFFEMVLFPMLIFMVAAFLLIGGIFTIGAWFNKFECQNLTEITKRKTEFRWFGGCYVEHEGELLPYDRWKLLDVRVTQRNTSR